MSRPSLKNKNVRKFKKSGSSYALTIPLEIIQELKWRLKQKVTLKKWGESILIKDWKRKSK